MKPVGAFRQAITGGDNTTIDQTWLVVMFAVFVVLPLVIISLVTLAALDVFLNHHEASVAGLGGGIAAVIAAVGAFVASCALILSQDRKPQPPQTTTVTTASKTEVTTP